MCVNFMRFFFKYFSFSGFSLDLTNFDTTTRCVRLLFVKLDVDVVGNDALVPFFSSSNYFLDLVSSSRVDR